MKVKAICNKTLNKVDHIDEKYNLAISMLVAGEMLLGANSDGQEYLMHPLHVSKCITYYKPNINIKCD
jgi:hypothetical protein